MGPHKTVIINIFILKDWILNFRRPINPFNFIALAQVISEKALYNWTLIGITALGGNGECF